jgi:hypothetical protein
MKELMNSLVIHENQEFIYVTVIIRYIEFCNIGLVHLGIHKSYYSGTATKMNQILEVSKSIVPKSN